MNKLIFSNFVIGALLLFSTNAFSFGASDDIPFAMHGELTFTHAATTYSQSCKIVMAGRTNKKNMPARITASQYFGELKLCGASTGGIHSPPSYNWDVIRTPNTKLGITIKSVFFSQVSGDCDGGKEELKLTWSEKNRYVIPSQKIGNCTVTGNLIITQDPNDVTFY